METLEKTENSIRFDNSYAQLPERFYARLSPSAVKSPSLIRLNRPLAEELGMDPDFLASPAGLEILAGNRVPEGAEPIALAYAGHQFGQFVPQLGDGRAHLVGEVVGRDGIRRDIQLKGSGPTPFSRAGDGRAALGPVLREYIVSEAMHALGIPATRALAAVATGEAVLREAMLPGGVLTRVARSHVRVGTFQYFAAREDDEAIRELADYVIHRHYPQCREASEPYLALLEAVIARQAELIARWLGIGFIHGVMNTDNMSIAGETIDFGPCAFMDHYAHDKVFSSIDHMGRYAFGNQPGIGQWNLARFAQCLLPLLADDEEAAIGKAQTAIDTYGAQFERQLTLRLGEKLGIAEPREDDLQIARALLKLMEESGADFTVTFRRLAELLEDGEAVGDRLRDSFADPEEFDKWVEGWKARLAEQGEDPVAVAERMRGVNPLYIPRNHLVEEAIAAAYRDNDFEPFEKLVAVLADPCNAQDGRDRYAQPPRPEEVVQQTFCGT